MTKPLVGTIADLTLADIGQLATEGRLPPVDTWNPSYCGDSSMRILPNGTWTHERSPITRDKMVRLLSTVLRRETDGSYVLVTPAEKLSIAVDDAPFIAIEMKSEGCGTSRQLAFRTNVGDLVLAGPDHRLWLEDRGHGPRLYLHVRRGLDALIGRSIYYELVNLAIDEAETPGEGLGLWSSGVYFALDPHQPN